MSNLIVGLVTTIFGIALGFWFNNIYDRPMIEYYTRPYYKIDDIAIGNIYLINSGRKSDHNIALTLHADIKDNNIKIVDLTSDYSIQHNDNKTIIRITELKPDEGADITFRDKGNVDEIDFDLISDYSNSKPIFETKWWHFSGITAFIISFALVVFGGGLVFLKSKPFKQI